MKRLLMIAIGAFLVLGAIASVDPGTGDTATIMGRATGRVLIGVVGAWLMYRGIRTNRPPRLTS